MEYIDHPTIIMFPVPVENKKRVEQIQRGEYELMGCIGVNRTGSPGTVSYSGLFWLKPPDLYITHTADQFIKGSKCFHVFLISSVLIHRIYCY